MTQVDRVTPVLVYEDLAAAHDFLVEAFGFEPGGVQHTPDGKAVHAEVRAGGGVIWLHRVTAEHGMVSPRDTADQANGGLVVYVADIDAHWRTARSRGAMIEGEPVEQPYGQREYAARDPEGHRWWFASPAA